MADWWLRTQLLAEEAINRGLDEDPVARYKISLRVKQEYADALNRHVQNAVQISEEQMRDHYEENKEVDLRINEPTKLSFTHIASNTLEESQAIFYRVKAGEDIGALAKELSIDYDKRRSGAVKNAPETAVSKRYGFEFLNAILYASQGDIIGPMKATLGMSIGERYEVARLEGKVPGRTKSFDEVKDYIKTRLERAAKDKAVKDLRKSY
jgi:parvulin-like peptidyl-prolyl isomerase